MAACSYISSLQAQLYCSHPLLVGEGGNPVFGYKSTTLPAVQHLQGNEQTFFPLTICLWLFEWWLSSILYCTFFINNYTIVNMQSLDLSCVVLYSCHLLFSQVHTLSVLYYCPSLNEMFQWRSVFRNCTSCNSQSCFLYLYPVVYFVCSIHLIQCIFKQLYSSSFKRKVREFSSKNYLCPCFVQCFHHLQHYCAKTHKQPHLGKVLPSLHKPVLFFCL